MRIFQDLGMTPFEALQTATVNPAEALRAKGRFGVVAPGARADLVLLSANPLDDVAHLSSVEAVSVRGVWLGRSARRDMLSRLKEIYRTTAQRMDRVVVTEADLDDYLGRLKTLHGSGFVFRDHDLELAASMFRKLGRPADARTLTAMKRDAAFGLSRF